MQTVQLACWDSEIPHNRFLRLCVFFLFLFLIFECLYHKLLLLDITIIDFHALIHNILGENGTVEHALGFSSKRCSSQMITQREPPTELTPSTRIKLGYRATFPSIPVVLKFLCKPIIDMALRRRVGMDTLSSRSRVNRNGDVENG
ncbi:predicted protein [Coccidioides posadasii str. Silveira]|uniref:Predicted protein n=2 Tax=Coccidioides posadasii TaxID=199306 RepID=E9CZD5_COCPS|nr:predicted protein [Coccidioides posadasii str. Silveira]KMM72857.1 hypothetical protein CPAG_09148 [Coccidioides posadasii RMSCC 3488]